MLAAPRAFWYLCPMALPNIGFVGAGRVGTALAVRLKEAGYRIVGAWSRSPESRQRFLSYLPEAQAFERPEELLEVADLIFLTTSDDAIPEVAKAIPWSGRHMVVHCSGALSLDVLEPARQKGADVGSFHPCQAFATIDQAIQNLPGSTIGIEASTEGLKGILKRMAEALGCPYVIVPPEGKVLYHAAAVFASNYTVALMGVAVRLLEALGIGTEEGTKLLLPLLRGTVANIQNVGLPKCLTGPIARGDITIIEKHLDTLRKTDPRLFRVYAILGLETIPLGVGKGTLSQERAEILKEIFEEALREGP